MVVVIHIHKERVSYAMTGRNRRTFVKVSPPGRPDTKDTFQEGGKGGENEKKKKGKEIQQN
jgi:hypothetical protein